MKWLALVVLTVTALASLTYLGLVRMQPHPAQTQGGEPPTVAVDPILLPHSRDPRESREHMESGRVVFDEMACWRCHSLGDEELPGNPDFINQGPDLARVGDRLSRQEIRESILYPNKIIAEPIADFINEMGESKMPAFEGAIDPDDLSALALFLSEFCVASIEKAGTVEANEANFQSEVLDAGSLVLLDFWAEWCAPCMELEPVLEELAGVYQGRLKICRIHVDQNPNLVGDYVPDNMFPCLIMMKNGSILERVYGTDPKMQPRDFLVQWIDGYLSKFTEENPTP